MEIFFFKVEEEFRKLAEESDRKLSESSEPSPTSTITSTTNNNKPATVPFIDDEHDLELTDTPKRPKPTTLDIPGVKRSIADKREVVSSPETPSYSSRPLPSSPHGPAFTDIVLRDGSNKYCFFLITLRTLSYSLK